MANQVVHFPKPTPLRPTACFQPILVEFLLWSPREKLNTFARYLRFAMLRGCWEPETKDVRIFQVLVALDSRFFGGRWIMNSSNPLDEGWSANPRSSL